METSPYTAVSRLGCRESKTYMAAALFAAGNILLPQLCHLMPQGGPVWLPIYFFTLVAAYKYGPVAGLLTAVVSPLANSALFGMPAAAALPAILVKSVVLALAASYVASRARGVRFRAVLLAVAAYQAIGFLAEWAMTGSPATAFQDIRLGWPGLLVQAVGGYALMRHVKIPK